MSDKLSDCPFCGNEAETEKIEEGCYGVGCGYCDFQLMSGNVGIGWHATEAAAIAAWNRRASPAPAIPAADPAAKIRALVANDSFAITFQSLGQYRSALLKQIDELKAAPAISESEWLPIETAPKDGSEVALLFAREFELSGRIYSRVRAASWIGDWSIPYSRLNPPIGWNPMPAAPVDAARKGEKS
ncbi:Lar family restriction alleviation protein [Burkholderia gladioli]|uniref:Lar family restriction alleviation protein n=1 Tax=Burkholderia gladioli TaxID=28095 RepID=UPI00163E2720|nr:Lar family restriction alleviation protein [Burkholderia gladioli]